MPDSQKINYQKELDRLIAGLGDRTPTLFLHACCAPCSSYVLEYLSQYFDITLFYYNPNIFPEAEYRKRVEEVRRLLSELPVKHPVRLQEGKYDPESFFALAKGHEAEPEGGERCALCYELRLREAAVLAKAGGYDYFTTTLSISPYKNAQKLNEIGARLEREYGVLYLPSDFKKRDGYRRSIALSKEYHLYRQDYCGCVFSKAERDRRVAEQANVSAENR
ncbi:epoxyqueuosine reductase QueH [Caproiciproducens sp. LBM24188]